MGRFGLTVPEGAQAICGICKTVCNDQQAKARHMAHEHGAIVLRKADFYEYRVPIIESRLEAA